MYELTHSREIYQSFFWCYGKFQNYPSGMLQVVHNVRLYWKLFWQPQNHQNSKVAVLKIESNSSRLPKNIWFFRNSNIELSSFWLKLFNFIIFTKLQIHGMSFWGWIPSISSNNLDFRQMWFTGDGSDLGDLYYLVCLPGNSTYSLLVSDTFRERNQAPMEAMCFTLED